MSGVVWEDLPQVSTPAPRGRPAWMNELEERPGLWARLPIRTCNGRTRGEYRARGFEVVTRTVDGDTRLYGRYVGPVQP